MRCGCVPFENGELVAIIDSTRPFEIDFELPARYRNEEWAVGVLMNGRILAIWRTNPFGGGDADHKFRVRQFPYRVNADLEARRYGETYDGCPKSPFMGEIRVVLWKAFFAQPGKTNGKEAFVDGCTYDDRGVSLK